MDMSEENIPELRDELAHLLVLRKTLQAESERITKAPLTTDVDEFLNHMELKREHHRQYINTHERITTISGILTKNK